MGVEISVVTGTRNRPEQIMRFVKSLADTCEVPTELIICDASDGDVDKDRFDDFVSAERLESITIIEEKPRLGTLRGYNRAFRECEGDWVVWFNDDCECVEGWQSAALSFMGAHPEVGIGIVYFKDNYGSPNEQAQYCCQVYQGIPHPNFGFLRRPVGNALGWFDERIGWMYGCDTSLGFAAVNAGFAVAPIPGCKVKHYREQDDVRKENYAVALKNDSSHDHKRFLEIWEPLIPELRRKHAKFRHLIGPTGID